MSETIERAAEALFRSGTHRTQNVKYCYRSGATAEQLADYRNRVAAQIEFGVAILDNELDRELLD